MSRRKPSELTAVLLLLPVVAVIVGPFLWLIVSSLKTEREIGRGEPFSFPAELMWQNYIDAWTVGNFGSLIGNSLINVAMVLALTLLICVPAGYALAKIRFPGREWVFYAFIFGLTIPVQAVIIPLYQPWRGPGARRRSRRGGGDGRRGSAAAPGSRPAGPGARRGSGRTASPTGR